jgi:hypothetical protein
LTPFIGREGELADLGRLLAERACRCITLVGPGGPIDSELELMVGSNFGQATVSWSFELAD